MSIGRVTWLTLALCAGCKADPNSVDDGWSGGLQAHGFEPVILVPGVQGYMTGEGLVTETLGYTSVHFQGTHTGASTTADVDQLLTTDVLSQTRLAIFESTWGTLCANGEGELDGTATLLVTSRHTDQTYETSPVPVALSCRETLTPTLTSVSNAAVTLNAPVALTADGLLLGEREGETLAELSGCFQADGASTCTAVGPVEVSLDELDPITRTGGSTRIPPALVGLQPGELQGEVRLVNRHASGEVTRSEPTPWTVTVLPSRLDTLGAPGASLGGIVPLIGAGFLGLGEDEGTELLVQGSFTPDGGGADRAVDVLLVTTTASHDTLNYVLDEADALGQIVDYRTESGTIAGTITPRFYLGGDTVSGASIAGSFRVEPLRQVVWLNLTQSYTDALVQFGLREADQAVNQQVLAVIERVYAGVNVEVRTEPPDDYRLFSVVDVTAIDPNGFGLLGYDNTPGKDTGNTRLYDHLGGLNALTQQDGYPGYGGVFLESIWAFSPTPPTSVTPLAGASDRFDQIFDPLRPDTGTPVTAAEAEALTPLTSGESCIGDLPRDRQVQCAVWVLGNIVGGTIAHELAHSFGLADPGGAGFHNSGDAPSRLMDAGDDRPFLERAALDGPLEHLCQGNYDYLRGILPTSEPEPGTSRSACN